ncbi:MAG: hypothetical protein ACFFB8_17660 [Promethearchaeota archaeon]
MKIKNKLIFILFFSMFIFLSTSLKVSVAATPDWVGVKAGDKFKWSVTVYGNTYVQFFEDITGSTMSTGPISDMGLSLSVRILNVSNQLYDSTFDFYWVNVSVIGTISAAGESEESPPIGIVIPRNTTLDYFSTIGTFMNYYSTGNVMYLGYFFVAKDLDWSIMANELNVSIPPVPQLPDINFTVNAREAGLEFSFSGGTIENMTIAPIYAYADFNKNGVVKKAVVKYGGDNLITLGPKEEKIPGYDLPILLGLTIINIIGIIFYIQKSKTLKY